MSIHPIKYPLFTLYELLRSYLLLQAGAQVSTGMLPVTWYAGIPLLGLVPFIFIMLSSNELKFATWLPLAALIKALGVVALSLFIARTLPDAFRFGATGDITQFMILARTIVIALGDLGLGIYCLGRYRILCK